MVFFTHSTLSASERLSVSSDYDPDGYRLVVDFPDGRQLIHRFFTQPELYRGTAKLQADLIGDGWRVVPGSDPKPHSRVTRGRHFPRNTRL